jgi:hypothetical protein
MSPQEAVRCVSGAERLSLPPSAGVDRNNLREDAH